MTEHHIRVSQRLPYWPDHPDLRWRDAEIMLWCECDWVCFVSIGLTLEYLMVIQDAHRAGKNGWEPPAGAEGTPKAMTPDGVVEIVPPWLQSVEARASGRWGHTRVTCMFVLALM